MIGRQLGIVPPQYRQGARIDALVKRFVMYLVAVFLGYFVVLFVLIILEREDLFPIVFHADYDPALLFGLSHERIAERSDL
jgi:hypothetical protein